MRAMHCGILPYKEATLWNMGKNMSILYARYAGPTDCPYTLSEHVLKEPA